MALATQAVTVQESMVNDDRVLPGYSTDYDGYSTVEGYGINTGGSGGSGSSVSTGNNYIIFYDDLYVILNNTSVYTNDESNSILSFKIYYKNPSIDERKSNKYEYEVREESYEPDLNTRSSVTLDDSYTFLNLNIKIYDKKRDTIIQIPNSMFILSPPMIRTGTNGSVDIKLDFYNQNYSGNYKIDVSFGIYIEGKLYTSLSELSSEFTVSNNSPTYQTIINPNYELKGIINDTEILPGEDEILRIQPKIYLSGGAVLVKEIETYTISIQETTSAKISFTNSNSSDFTETSISHSIPYVSNGNSSIVFPFIYIRNDNTSSSIISAKIKIKAEGIKYPLEVNENTYVNDVDKEFIFSIKLLGSENGEEPELSKISFNKTSIPNQQSISGTITNGTRNIVKITSSALANNYDLSISADNGNLKKYNISIKNIYTGYISKKVTITFNVFYTDSSLPETISYDFTLLPKIEGNNFLIKITVKGSVEETDDLPNEDAYSDFIINKFTFQ